MPIMSHTVLFIGMLWCASDRILNWLSLGFQHSTLWQAKGRLKTGMKLSFILVSSTLFSIQNYLKVGVLNDRPLDFISSLSQLSFSS